MLPYDAVTKMAAGVKWTSEEIIALLDAYSEKSVQDYIEGMASNKNVNEEIQKIMKEESAIERTTQQIENKVKKLRSGYGKLKSSGAERPYLTSALTSLEKVAFQYWDRLDQILGSRPVNDPPQGHVFESQVEEEHQSTVATDEASSEEPGPSEENQTTTKQRKASKRPPRKKPRLADALQQSNEQIEHLRETISKNVITPEMRSSERREDREFFREMFGNLSQAMMGMTQMLTQVHGHTGNQQLPLFHSFPPQATQYPLHPMPQQTVHSSPYYSDRHTPPLSSSRCSSPYTDKEKPTLPDL